MSHSKYIKVFRLTKFSYVFSLKKNFKTRLSANNKYQMLYKIEMTPNKSNSY